MITVVELVGVPGSGKTTVAGELRKHAGISVLTLPAVDGLMPRLRGGLRALWLSIKHRLAFKEALSLALNCSTVEVGLEAYCAAATSKSPCFFVIDEGPLRILRVCHYRTQRGLAAWQEFATLAMVKLVKLPISIVLVNFELDHKIASMRLRERTVMVKEFAASRNAPKRWKIKRKLNHWSGRYTGPPINNFNLTAYVDEFVTCRLASSYRVLKLMIGEDESPEDVGLRLIGLIELGAKQER